MSVKEHSFATKQSIANYEYFYDKFKIDLKKENKSREVTDMILLDKFYKKGFINEFFYNEKKQEFINLKKQDEINKFNYLTMINSILSMIFIILFFPLSEFYTFKICYFIYLFIIYIVTISFIM